MWSSELPELHRLHKLLAEAFEFCADGLLSSVHLVHLTGPRLRDLEPLAPRRRGEAVGGGKRGVRDLISGEANSEMQRREGLAVQQGALTSR